jgi:hypothetical protein
VLGFLILALGIVAWIFTLTQRFHASAEAMLVVFGGIILALTILAAKVFSKVGN